MDKEILTCLTNYNFENPHETLRLIKIEISKLKTENIHLLDKKRKKYQPSKSKIGRLSSYMFKIYKITKEILEKGIKQSSNPSNPEKDRSELIAGILNKMAYIE